MGEGVNVCVWGVCGGEGVCVHEGVNVCVHMWVRCMCLGCVGGCVCNVQTMEVVKTTLQPLTLYTCDSSSLKVQAFCTIRSTLAMSSSMLEYCQESHCGNHDTNKSVQS